MWGCLRWLMGGSLGLLLLLTFIIGGGWYYLGTSSFAGLVMLRVEKTLEARLGRHVFIHDVVIDRSAARVVINDLRIANSPGAVHPYFATVKQLVIKGGIDSFWGRRIRVGRVDIIEPRIFFEVYPAGSTLVHNFPHWQSGPRSRYEIYHLDIGTLYITSGVIDFLDRRHDIAAVATNMTSQVKVTSKEDLYAGMASSALFRVRIQDYQPVDFSMRGQFRYTPGVLELQSIALNGGPDLRLFLSGRLQPLTEGVYNLHLTSEVGLNRVREVFRVQRPLAGTIALDTMLRGRQGTFTMAGRWTSAQLRADVYELTAARGRLHVTDTQAMVDVEHAEYGGGALTAHYMLPQYSEPYPMSVDLHYNGISAEKLFSDWGLENTGLRGRATGRLAYHWNKDKLLRGAGEGMATLSKSSVAFSNAKYPVPIGGSTVFTLDNGVVTFRRADLVTDTSRVALTGTFRIEDASTDLLLNIHSADFSELDRIGYNFAHTAGKKTYTLLGLGGAGDITGSVKGRIKAPQVMARISGTGTKYNNVILGNSDIDLRYDGATSTLTFERAVFREGNGRLTMTGTVAFPDRGPSPRFDLAVDAVNYPVDRAVETVNLKLAAHGLGTGRMVITGTPDEGKVTFASLTVTQPGGSRLDITGSMAWLPGKGNVNFDLNIAAQSFPVADIVKFLDLGTLPVIGELTGTMRLNGPKSGLGGTGTVTVRNGSVFGEPVTAAKANIVFTQGTLRATNVSLAGPAGTITGQAELNLTTNQFNYSIQSSSIDLSKLKAVSSIARLLGGNVTLTSTGAGTFEQPELVLNATLNEATLRGLNLPPGSAPPTLYIAIRNGQLLVRGSAADVLTIEGNGSVATDGTLSGLIRIRVSDVARMLAMSPNTASLPASGSLIADLQLGGKLSSIEALRIDATFPEFNLKVSEHTFTPDRPMHISLRDGRIVFDDFQLALQQAASTFVIAGYVEVTGAKRLALDVRGTLEAALLQLFIPGVRAEGHIQIAGGVLGTFDNPRLAGTAEFRDAQVRFPGFPQLIDHITGTLIFREDSVDIDSLSASVGGGKVIAGGSITLAGLMPQRVRVNLQGTDVTIRYFEGISVEGNFGPLQLNGDLERMALQGDIEVTRALYSRDIDIGAKLLTAFLSRRALGPTVAASWQDRLALNLHLTGTNALAVRNNLADLTGSGDLQVTGTLANPVILGLVTLNEGGKVRFQNIDYTLVRGSINFQNPFRIDPFFDVSLEARVSGGISEIESGPIDVTVTVTGTIDRVTPSITSDPPASDITLFSLLGLGGLLGRSASGQGVEPGTATKSLLFSSLSFLGSKVLPFADSFAIDPGTLDTTSDPGPKVSIMKRLSNDITAFVIYNTKDSRNKIVLEWQVNPDWVLQFTRDQLANEYRGEARFRRRYDGRWAWGSHGRNPMALFARFHELEAAAPAPPAQVPAAQSPAMQGSNVPQHTGATVTTISFRADSRLDTSVLKQYVSLKPGEPLSLRNIQNSIKSLFATGDFRDIRVEALPDANGVAVTFSLFTNFRVADIRFEGLGGADRDRATRELTVHLGDVLSLNAVDHSAVAAQDFLKRSGYLAATVDPETTFSRETSRASVIFHVTRGDRAKIGSVVIAGKTAPFAAQDLINAMKRGPGKPFQIADARADAERMRGFMHRREYRKADVTSDNYTYDATTRQVTLHYTATAGPIVKVELVGIDRDRKIRGLLPFKKNQQYSEDAIDSAANDITDLLQQRGYYRATVDTEGRLGGNVWTSTFHVKPGQQFKLANLAFSGNEKIGDRKLAGVVQTSTTGGFRSLLANLFHRPTGGVTLRQLNTDRDALESYYRLEGFSEVKVDAAAVSTNPSAGAMVVDFPIVEGPQTLVSAVSVEGNEQVPTRNLPKVTLKAGEPLNPQIEHNDVIALQSFYADRGNAEVQIKPREEISLDKTSAKVTYVIAEGPRIKLGEVIVRGNTYTTTKTVLRTSDLDKGDPFSYSSILQAQQSLYRLGIFQRVDVQPEQMGTPVSDRNVTISIQEGKDLTIAGSGGITWGITGTNNKPSPLGSISIAHRNLFGTGRYLGLEIIGARQRKEGFLTYREPFIGPFDIPVQVTLFQSDALHRGARVVQRGTFIEASRVARYQTRWSVRYEYRLSECVEGDLCSLVKQARVPGLDPSVTDIKISSLTPTFFWDKRDDTIDPHHGFLTSASIEYAFRVLSADANFLKEFAQGSWYLPVSTRSVFALSGRAGLIQDRYNFVDGKQITGIPLSERFTGGGESSHRAYPLDLLGITCADPRDASLCTDKMGVLHGATLIDLDEGNGKHTIAPIGGRSIFVINAEYRFPVTTQFGGTVFFDAGNVFDQTRIDFGDLRYGVGTGVRYLSPVGPIRFDIGYKLHRQVLRLDESGKAIFERPFAYFITLGYAF